VGHPTAPRGLGHRRQTSSKCGCTAQWVIAVDGELSFALQHHVLCTPSPDAVVGNSKACFSQSVKAAQPDLEEQLIALAEKRWREDTTIKKRQVKASVNGALLEALKGTDVNVYPPDKFLVFVADEGRRRYHNSVTPSRQKSRSRPSSWIFRIETTQPSSSSTPKGVASSF